MCVSVCMTVQTAEHARLALDSGEVKRTVGWTGAGIRQVVQVRIGEGRGLAPRIGPVGKARHGARGTPGEAAGRDLVGPSRGWGWGWDPRWECQYRPKAASPNEVWVAVSASMRLVTASTCIDVGSRRQTPKSPMYVLRQGRRRAWGSAYLTLPYLALPCRLRRAGLPTPLPLPPRFNQNKCP